MTLGHGDLMRAPARLFDRPRRGGGSPATTSAMFTLEERLGWRAAVGRNIRTSGRDLRWAAARLRRRQRRQRSSCAACARSATSVQVPDGGHEPAADARRGDAVPDPVGPVPVHLQHLRARSRCSAARSRSSSRRRSTSACGRTRREPRAGDPGTDGSGAMALADHRQVHQLRRLRAECPNRGIQHGRGSTRSTPAAAPNASATDERSAVQVCPVAVPVDPAHVESRSRCGPKYRRLTQRPGRQPPRGEQAAAPAQRRPGLGLAGAT